MSRTKKFTAAMAATALVLGACSSDGNDAADPTDSSGEAGNGDDAVRTDDTPVRIEDEPTRFAKVRLARFDECDAFLDYVHTEGASRVGAFGFDQQRYWFGEEMMVEEAMEDDAMEESASDDAAFDTGATAESAPSSSQALPESDGSDTFSETNVQVEGVDEPDIVKTDGQRVLALVQGRLVYIDIDDQGRAAERRGSIEISTDGQNNYVWGNDLLLAGDRAFVIASTEGTTGIPEPFETSGDAESEFVDDIASEPFPGGEWVQRTAVIEVDLSDPDDLRIENTLLLDGRYVSARAIGDTARVIVSSPPSRLDFLFPSGPGSTERAAEANRELVQSTTLADWMPTFDLTGADGTRASGDLVDCSSIHAPGEFAGFDMLSVVTLATDESLTAPTATTSLMASGDTVYASQDRLYVATNEWIPPTLDDQERGIWEETYQTGIHRFALPADAAAEYEASGLVEGHLLNQFSMHDHDGTFFVATTTGTPWSGENSVSQIVSMQPDGDRLEQVGIVGGLGQGERIFSVRYVGDTAYVVTFRQIDPFYVVDLSSPSDMAVLGELKIPGFSSYLHPISDDLVLGVGQDATDEGFTTGTKVSLFDVSDVTDPTELDVWTMPNASSDAEFDHRAFLWWAPTSTAVLPLVSWSDQFAGAVVLNVTDEGISEQGRITHLDEDREPTGITDCRVYTSDDIEAGEESELFWIVQEPTAQFQACGPDQVGGATGMFCDTVPVDEISNWFGIDDAALDTEGVDRFELCWQDGFDGYDERVIRTLVIGDQLWTLSPQSFQANDLASLERTTKVTL
ncbi:MAG: beta-propeller domain-containing protein [Ilumatobacter sp.]